MGRQKRRPPGLLSAALDPAHGKTPDLKNGGPRYKFKNREADDMQTNLSVEPRRGWTKLVCTELARRNPGQQEEFAEEYDRRKKITSEAYAFWLFFGSHYAYLGKWGIQVIFWLTGAGLGLWWFVDVFRVGALVRDHNKNVATAVLRDMTTIWGHT